MWLLKQGGAVFPSLIIPFVNAGRAVGHTNQNKQSWHVQKQNYNINITVKVKIIKKLTVKTSLYTLEV